MQNQHMNRIESVADILHDFSAASLFAAVQKNRDHGENAQGFLADLQYCSEGGNEQDLPFEEYIEQ